MIDDDLPDPQLQRGGDEHVDLLPGDMAGGEHQIAFFGNILEHLHAFGDDLVVPIQQVDRLLQTGGRHVARAQELASLMILDVQTGGYGRHIHHTGAHMIGHIQRQKVQPAHAVVEDDGAVAAAGAVAHIVLHKAAAVGGGGVVILDQIPPVARRLGIFHHFPRVQQPFGDRGPGVDVQVIDAV